jgi:4-amino-4-deoxy-L-arabinose transferase-like glycosyltransferase
VRFCLAWIVPTWIAFELIPTKLPHYTLPVFPALATLVAAGALSRELPSWIRRIIVWHAALLAGMVLLGLAGAVWVLDSAQGATAAVCSLLIGAFWLSIWTKWRHDRVLASALSFGAVVALYATYFGWLLPRVDNLWLSRSAAALIEQHRQDSRTPVISVGYTEPSLVFLCGTSTILEVTGDPGIDDATHRLRADPRTLVLVDATLLPRFTEPFTELGRVRGINYSKGTRLELVLITAQSASAALVFDVPGAEGGEPYRPER